MDKYKEEEISSQLREILIKLSNQMLEYNLNLKHSKENSIKVADEIRSSNKEIIDVLKNGAFAKLTDRIEKFFEKLTEKMDKVENVIIAEFTKLTAEMSIHNQLLKERNELDKQRYKQSFEIKKLTVTGWFKLLGGAIASGGFLYLLIEKILGK